MVQIAAPTEVISWIMITMVNDNTSQMNNF